MKEYLKIYHFDGKEWYKRDGVLYPLDAVPHRQIMQSQEIKEIATMVAEAQDQCRVIVERAVSMMIAHLRGLACGEVSKEELLKQSCELISLDNQVKIAWCVENGLVANGNKMAVAKAQVAKMLDELKVSGLIDNTALKLLGKVLKTKAGAVVTSDSLRLVRDIELPHNDWLAIRQQLINAFDPTPPVGSLRVYLEDGEGGAWWLQKIGITGNDVEELAFLHEDEYPAA